MDGIDLCQKRGLSDQLLSGRPRLRSPRIFGQTRLDGWINRLILGDNLAVLRALRQSAGVAGEVRLVYIDPPFATDQEFRFGDVRTSTVSSSLRDRTAYEDRLVGPAYLEYLRQRLVLLRELMADNGSIYLHIDCKIGHYVKVLMDQVFGQERFINDITRIKCNPKNFERRAFGNVKDMILFYSKSESYLWNEPREELTQEDISRLFSKTDERGRQYTTTPIHAPGETRNGPTGDLWEGLLPPSGRHWRYSPKELSRLQGQGLIEWSSTGNPRKKIYAEDAMRIGKKRQDIWAFKDPQYPSYPTQKNLELLETIINCSSNPGDLVLDCFAGSGTTLVAAEKHGRRWIGIDDSPHAIKVAAKRLAELPRTSAFGQFRTSRPARRRANE
jgi:adenine-specific DNA-methyltransferase